jgi:hypothetical protein
MTSTSLTVITNHVPRDIIDAWQLTVEQRAEFDYLDWDAIEAGEASAEFVSYKGQLYDLGEFTTTRELNPGAGHHDLGAWDGYQSDTFFSGIVVRYVDDFERVIVGRYYA